MSRAEKDAIESMELIVKYGGDNLLSKEHRKKLDIVLNLIKKQDNKIKFLLDDEKSLKEMNRNQMKIIEKQQKEINKAIEYIENAKKELNGCGNYYLSDLLNILKGELNE